MADRTAAARAEASWDAVGLRLLCLLPSIPLGGMERAAVRVVDQLARRGAEAHFVAEQRWGAAVQRHIESVGGSWTGVPFVASFSRPKSLLDLRWAARSFVRTASDFERVFDAYRPRQLLATSFSVAYFARRLARRDEVVSVFRLPNPPGFSASPAKRALDRLAWNSVYAAFDRLVCNARYTAAVLAEVVGDDSKIVVVRNFPPTCVRAEWSDAPPIEPRRRRIVYLGQIARQKGVDLLVEAVTALIRTRPDVELLLAGPDVWRDPFGEEIRARVREAGLADRIRFVGVITDVHGLLRSALVHVCPSVSAGESFPNVVIEAKQAGLASVVFATAGLPEAVTDGVDGLVTSERSAAALEAALARVIDDEALRARLAEGATRSLAAYSEDAIATRWIELFTAGKAARGEEARAR